MCWQIPPRTDSTNSLYPTALDVRPTLFFLALLLDGRHGTTDATYAMPALGVERAMSSADDAEKLPDVVFSPMDDGRDKQALFAIDAAQSALAGGVDDGDLFGFGLAPAMGAGFFLGAGFAIGVKFGERARELVRRYFDLVASGTSATFLVADADEGDTTGTGILFVFGATPTYAHSRQDLPTDGDIENAVAWLDKFDIGVLLTNEADNLGRVDRGERHMGAELYACESGYVVESLTVFAAAECQIVAIGGIVLEG